MGSENRSAADAVGDAVSKGDPPSASAPRAGGPSSLEATDGSSSKARRADAGLALLLEAAARAPEGLDFFQLLRRLQVLAGDRPRIGEAPDPAKEPIRLGQEPSLAFAPAALSRLEPGRNGRPPRLLVNFFGLLGPNGPLPLHLTEYARERLQHAGDPTFSRFLDVFNHRMLLLIFRSWASAQPTVSHDRPQGDRFLNYVGSLEGLGLDSLRDRDSFPDSAKLHYAGRLAGPRNAEGLAAVIGDFFEMPAAVQQFVPDWLDLPASQRWGLGRGRRLGVSTTLGARVASRQTKFRVLLGPLNRGQFHRMLPGGRGLATLSALVRNCAGDDLRWDVRLSLHEQVDEPWLIGRSQLGWTSWLGRAREGAVRRDDLILDPQAEAARPPSSAAVA